MQPIGAIDLLDVWERGALLRPFRRAAALVSAACRELSPEQIDALTLGDRDRLLLRARALTFGPGVKAVASCPSCGTWLDVGFDANDVLARIPTGGPTTIQRDDYLVQFRLPTCPTLPQSQTRQRRKKRCCAAVCSKRAMMRRPLRSMHCRNQSSTSSPSSSRVRTRALMWTLLSPAMPARTPGRRRSTWWPSSGRKSTRGPNGRSDDVHTAGVGVRLERVGDSCVGAAPASALSCIDCGAGSMNRDLAGLDRAQSARRQSRRAEAATAIALRAGGDRRPPPAAVESAHTIASASPIHSTGRDADGHRDPLRADIPIVEESSRPSGRALTNEMAEEGAEVGPPHTVVATVVRSREQESPFGEEAARCAEHARPIAGRCPRMPAGRPHPPKAMAGTGSCRRQ